MSSLSADLRNYTALNNHLGAERMMTRAADGMDRLIDALLFVDGLKVDDKPKLNSGERAVIHAALISVGVEPCQS